MTTKHIFLDTMMYMHFRPVQEVDWAGILEADEVTLVVPRITVTELDKHKNTHVSRVVRDRIKRFLTQLDDWAKEECPTLRSNIRIKYLPLPPTINMQELGLERTSNDDVLVATILDYRSKTGANVLLISYDATPRLTASHLGVDVMAAPENLRLPEELTPLEKENQELKRQVQKLSTALPVLAAQFVGHKGRTEPLKFRLPQPIPFPEKDISETMASIRSKYRHYSVPRPSQPLDRITRSSVRSIADMDAMELRQRVAASFRAVIGIEPEEYVRANRDIDAYVSRYEQYLRQHWEWENACRRTIGIAIDVANTGSAPAEDVDVSLHFPDGMRVWAGNTVTEEPKVPMVPIPPLKTSLRTMDRRLDVGHVLRSFTRPDVLSGIQQPSPPSSFRIEKKNSCLVSDKIARIKHGEKVAFREITIEFDSFASAKSFGIDYQLRPANLPDPVSGRLDVIVTKDSVSDDVNC